MDLPDVDLPEQIVCLNPDDKEEPTNNEKKKKKPFLSGMTLEPMWFGVTISFSMGFVAFKNMFLERACLVDLGHSYEECFHSEPAVKAAIELEAQKIVSSISVVSGFVGGFLTSVVLIFLGPWSDNSGRRKPLILLPLAGMILTSTSLLAMQAFPRLSTVWAVYAEIIPLSLGGNFSMLVMASFSYLGDICYKTGKCATTVMGNNTGFITLFIVIGSLLAPVLYRTIGFVGMFGISIVLEITSFAYAYFKVKDVNIAKKMANIFDLTLPLQSLKCILKKREGNRRLIVLLMVLVPCAHSVSFINEISITYLYARNKFAWSEVEYSIYLAVRSIVHVIGAFSIVHILKKKMHMRDEVIGMVGGLSQMGATLMLLFSHRPWMMFASTIFGLFSRAVMIAERPVLNKQITASEQGKINSITAVLEKCLSFVFVPLSNYIYFWTIAVYPSAFLLISVIACFVQILAYGIVVKLPQEAVLKTEDVKESILKTEDVKDGILKTEDVKESVEV